MQSAWKDAAGHHSLSTFSVEFPPHCRVAVSGFAHFVSMTHVAGASRRLTPPADLDGHDHVPVADERPIFRVTAMRVQLTSLALGYTLNTAAGREGVPLDVPVADRIPTAGGPRQSMALLPQRFALHGFTQLVEPLFQSLLDVLECLI